VGASVIGSAHGTSGAPCQDAHMSAILHAEEGPVLAIAVGDGAGSCARSDVGSRVACDAAIAAIGRPLGRRAHVGTITRDDVERWILSAQAAVSERALEDDAPLREYRTTMLLAVIGRRRAVYAQIGDGAIVVGSAAAGTDAIVFSPVFWPENGEYANTTYFMTDPESLTHLQIKVAQQAPDEVAILSDGLQMLALSYRDRTAHAPFFQAMFGSVRQARKSSIPAMGGSLEAFLGSEQVLARTDDDKTLVLATRLTAPIASAGRNAQTEA
jgi:hypothetical protein